jgi:RNA polymerase sigma-32 factor
MSRSSLPTAADSLNLYLAEISKHPLLSAEQEQSLARAYVKKGDSRAAHLLVTSNLRFVVKVAHEYRSYGFKMSDLIQEGNIGLMKAVQKFDPEKGIRLISYAVWWIRAYIQNYILSSFSLVKVGTTQAQRKLFFSLARTKRELDKASAEHGADSDGEDVAKIAKQLGVKPSEVEEMTQRMGSRDFSLDAPLGDEGGFAHVDLLADDGPAHDDELSAAQEATLLQGGVAAAVAQLDPRERYIIEQRVLRDHPITLKEIGEHFGISRERARQLELRAKSKLKEKLLAVAVEVDWPTNGVPVEIDDRALAFAR